MKIALVYVSPNGTTRLLTNVMAESLCDLGTVTVFDIGRGDFRNHNSINPDTFREFNLLGIGSPTYHTRAFEPITRFIKTILPRVPQNGTVRSGFVYITYAGIISGRSLLNMARGLHRAGYTTLAGLKISMPHFWHSTENLLGESARSLLEELPGILQERIENPPEWNEISKSLSYQRPFAQRIYPFTRITGRINRVNININPDLCIKCGLCMKECPVSALKLEPDIKRDRSKCIYCYHCIARCPTKAITSDVDRMKRIVARNLRFAGMEEPSEAIY